jgi:hypothetical protein
VVVRALRAEVDARNRRPPEGGAALDQAAE